MINRQAPLHVDIVVAIRKERDRYVVSSEHKLPSGTERSFSVEWPENDDAKPEYAWGLSLVHDVKDHYFWGMPISQMAEFQAICQIELARALLTRRADWLVIAVTNITREIGLELHAAERPRVYTPGVGGVLTGPNNSDDEGKLAAAVQAFCFQIAVPELLEVYARSPELLELQCSVQDNLLIGESLLPGIKWHDASKQTLKLGDNEGFKTTRRAFVNSDCFLASRRIWRAWNLWLDSHDVGASWLRYSLLQAEQ